MRKDIAELWAKELESGFWEQGKYFLEHSQTYCVYGVLTNLAATYGVCSHNGKNIGMFDGEISLAPISVIKWAGLNSQNGVIKTLKYPLAEMNDRNKNFKELAEIIRKHYDEL
jgi:hypothetical protein